ncbi:MAG: N-acetyl-gamma-glutamyl-phosphate reductase [Succinivibrionaceae bacterium]|nr:N-acetyl-gamma-glutamyl-phosphate reductase [Succinivibrionaceae bacterium]
MLKAAVIGASGYTGRELVGIILRHSHLTLSGTYVSPGSSDAGKRLGAIHGDLYHRTDTVLEPLTDPAAVGRAVDVAFLATEHKVSHDLAPILLEAGCAVFDLSGAHRVKDPAFYQKYYGFTHEHPEVLEQSIYALCEWCDLTLLPKRQMISLPGCYPTAAQLALKPLIDTGLLDPALRPVINAVSGVTGAGRKAKLSNSFCEVSLNAYGVFQHRHQPEISTHLGREVIFNPHLGNFKRGILETITCKLAEDATVERVSEAYATSYREDMAPLVRLKTELPKLQDVQGLPFCDIGFKIADGYIVICSAIDNLLKGAASQAVQALNLRYNFPETEGLL